MNKVLITGVTGFVGANLVGYLQESNTPMVGLTRDLDKARQQFKQGSITLVNNIDSSVIDDFGIDAIIHLAGIAHDLSNQYKAEDYYRVNFENTTALYDQFLKSKATKFIFLSSIKAAVDISPSPVDEMVTPVPITDYGKSKRQAEEYIQGRELPEGKKYYILRPCMIHGPGNKGNLNLLYKYVKSGLPYPLGAFRNQRSFLSIDNFNFIISQIIQRPIELGIYNLADEGYLSTAELFGLIARAMNKKPLVLNIPPFLINVPAAIVGKKHMLNKLTESMMVSNTKLLHQLGGTLPVGIGEGILKTIKSFDE